ncbi:MAG TPA: hypothetical protein PK306_24030 [Aquabacterium sp.]|nr:hypothetical protein [Aquabacterium sp.]
MNISARLWLPTLTVAAVFTVIGAAVAMRTGGQIERSTAALQDSEKKLYDAAA